MRPASNNSETLVAEKMIAGRIVSIHGVKGWVKVNSFTEPRENLFKYGPWWLKTSGGWKEIEFDDFRKQGKGLIAHIVGLDDRDKARNYCQQNIAVKKEVLPELSGDELYWHQLEGLTAITVHGGERKTLGVVKQLLETGANDVLMVKGNSDSLDRKERLIPYVDQFVLNVDLEAGEIEVDWDPDF
ncbi:ribosome maturation factor RimM [bacterium SCSIO 12696]|nr:ribosome maturation factor RimM [bacterium SCSIO 12696]